MIDILRMKYKLDEAARIDYALQEGEKKGRQQGELIGRIVVLQELLGIVQLKLEPRPSGSRYFP